MSRNRATLEDPRGLIAESYSIAELTAEQARSIFLDWAMTDAPADPYAAIEILLGRYLANYADHPMTKILSEAIDQRSSPKLRRGRRRRD